MTSALDSPTSTVLVRERRTSDLRLVERRPWDVVVTRLRGATLDRRLAVGELAENDRLLAVRAATLVRPRFRHSLAQCWADVLVRAARPTTWQVPLARARLADATGDIAELVELLRSHRPVAAAGVASARLLLITADSPVYAAGGADTDLRRALQVASQRAR